MFRYCLYLGFCLMSSIKKSLENLVILGITFMIKKLTNWIKRYSLSTTGTYKKNQMDILERNIYCLKLKTNLMCLRVHSIWSNIWCKKLKKSTNAMWVLVYRKCEFIVQHTARCVTLFVGVIYICVVFEKSIMSTFRQ